MGPTGDRPMFNENEVTSHKYPSMTYPVASLSTDYLSPKTEPLSPEPMSLPPTKKDISENPAKGSVVAPVDKVKKEADVSRKVNSIRTCRCFRY